MYIRNVYSVLALAFSNPQWYHLPAPLQYCPVYAAKDHISSFCHSSALRAYVQLIVHHNPLEILFSHCSPENSPPFFGYSCQSILAPWRDNFAFGCMKAYFV